MKLLSIEICMKLLVLDIDETLVHATKTKLDIPHQLKVADYYVYERPDLDGFLRSDSKIFELALWSSSSTEYVEAIRKHIEAKGVALKFAWSVDRCKQKPSVNSGGYVYLKDLRKLRKFGYCLEDVVIIDDTPEKLRQSSSRLIVIEEYLGSHEDNCLSAALNSAKVLAYA